MTNLTPSVHGVAFLRDVDGTLYELLVHNEINTAVLAESDRRIDDVTGDRSGRWFSVADMWELLAQARKMEIIRVAEAA